MDILFQIHYEWNKELFCLYYQTQNRKYRRILLFFCGAVIIFSFCLCSKIGREMIMTVIRQIKRCRFHQIKTGLSEHLTMG